MKYSMDQIKKGVATYLDAEFMPLIDDGFKRVMVGAAMSIAISKYANMVPTLNQNKFVKTLDIIDENSGDVDLDTLYNAIQQQMPKDGFTVDIPIVGTTRFKTGDIEKLYKTIQATK